MDLTNINDSLERVPGSFRDPSGHVFKLGGRILRTVSRSAAGDYVASRDHPCIAQLVKEGRLIASHELDAASFAGQLPDAAFVLEHPAVEHISYPYEWPFSLMREAALAHLDLHMALLEAGFTLTDATAYNIQFVSGRPVFIDRLAIRRYRDGELWGGHRQFCEQFLNPLLLRTLFAVSHNAWYRGALEGIPTPDLANLLSLRHKLSLKILLHVYLQAKLQARSVKASTQDLAQIRKRTLSKRAFHAMLSQLRKWMESLVPLDQKLSVWRDYAKSHTYRDEEARAKSSYIDRFCRVTGVRSVWDLGCNAGDYSLVAFEAGAQRIVGFDFDDLVLDAAYDRLTRNGHNFLPLWLDAANPSPNQGWRQVERLGLAERSNADAILALAFAHHLAIGRNTGLKNAVDWIVSLAPKGIIEFVPKNDPTVQKMLALRDDIFSDYTPASFEACLGAVAAIVDKLKVSESGRTLYWYERN